MGNTTRDQREERNQSRLDIEIVAAPRVCGLCGVQLEQGDGGICAGCLAKRAAETPPVIAVMQQVDLSGRVRSSRPTRDDLVLDYLRHCETCPECSRIVLRRMPG